uniref:Mitochondrial glutamate carrier 1 n=1 Tax=Schistocephalus solidus TaxID=70667 RepID=A0A183T0Q7_SCHSO
LQFNSGVIFLGSGVNLLLITPEKAIKLVCNDFFRYHLKPEGKSLTPLREMIAGGGAGLCQIIVTTPMELLKIQLQDAGRTAGECHLIFPLRDRNPGRQTVNCCKLTVEIYLFVHSHKGMAASVTVNGSAVASGTNRLSATRLALGLIREKGIFGLYRGVGATALRDVTFSVMYFPLFAHFDNLGPRRKDGTGIVFYWSFLSGCSASTIAAFLVTPMDVVKTRLQTLSHIQGEARFNGILDCFVKTFRGEGLRALFKGAGCRVLVMAPLFGIAQTVYYLGVAEYLFSFGSRRFA